VINDEPGVLRVACLALEAGGYIVAAYRRKLPPYAAAVTFSLNVCGWAQRLGARVIEMASRVRLAFAAACPDASLIRHIATALMPGP